MFNFNRRITLPNPHFTDKSHLGVGGKQFNHFRVKFLRRMVTRCEIIDDQGNVVADQVVLKPGEDDNHHTGMLMALKSTFKYLEPLYSSTVLLQLYNHLANDLNSTMAGAFHKTGLVVDIHAINDARDKDAKAWKATALAAACNARTEGYEEGVEAASTALLIEIKELRSKLQKTQLAFCFTVTIALTVITLLR